MESTEGMRQRIGGRDGKPAHQQRLACGFALLMPVKCPLIPPNARRSTPVNQSEYANASELLDVKI